MGWSFPEALKRTGGPALGVFIALTVMLIVKREPGESVGDIILSSALLMAAVWLAGAVVMYLAKRIFAERPTRR